MSHCIDVPCDGAKFPSGTGLSVCLAIHAEQNALLQCKNVEEILAIFTTTFPCSHCLKLLANTSCEIIYYKDIYHDIHQGLDFWYSSSSGREARQIAC